MDDAADDRREALDDARVIAEPRHATESRTRDASEWVRSPFVARRSESRCIALLGTHSYPPIEFELNPTVGWLDLVPWWRFL